MCALTHACQQMRLLAARLRDWVALCCCRSLEQDRRRICVPCAFVAPRACPPRGAVARPALSLHPSPQCSGACAASPGGRFALPLACASLLCNCVLLAVAASCVEQLCWCRVPLQLVRVGPWVAWAGVGRHCAHAHNFHVLPCNLVARQGRGGVAAPCLQTQVSPALVVAKARMRRSHAAWV